MKQLAFAAVAAALIPVATTAEGQEQDKLGIQIGAFTARPSLTISESYDLNIFVQESSETDSFITVVAPRLSVETNWNRHGIRLNTGLDYGYIGSSTDDNYLDYFGNLNGVLDVSRAVKIFASAGYSHDHESRGSDDVPGNADEPVELDNFSASLSSDVEFGRFRVSPFGNIAYLDFQDVDAIGGGSIDEDDRDRTEIEGGIEIGYKVRRGYEAFVRSAYQVTDYDDAVDSGGVDRDSDEYRILGGFKVDLTRLLTASIGVGYQNVDYDDPALDDRQGVAADIGVEWSITRRTTLFGAGSIEVDETTVGGASGSVESEASLGVTHELLRNLGISGSVTYVNRDFEGIARNDDLYVGRIGAEWTVTPNFVLSPEYRIGFRELNQAGLDYTRHQIRLSGTLRF